MAQQPGKTISRTFALFAVALLAACGDAGQPDQASASSAAVVATEAQDGATLTLRVGQELEVRLHGNETIDPPTAWSPETVPINLRMIRAEIVSDDPEADGAGATWSFRFTALTPGSELLTFEGGDSGRRVAFTVVTSHGYLYAARVTPAQAPRS